MARRRRRKPVADPNQFSMFAPRTAPEPPPAADVPRPALVAPASTQAVESPPAPTPRERGTRSELVALMVVPSGATGTLGRAPHPDLNRQAAVNAARAAWMSERPPADAEGDVPPNPRGWSVYEVSSVGSWRLLFAVRPDGRESLAWCEVDIE